MSKIDFSFKITQFLTVKQLVINISLDRTTVQVSLVVSFRKICWFKLRSIEIVTLSWVSATGPSNVPLHSPHLKNANTPVFGTHKDSVNI